MAAVAAIISQAGRTGDTNRMMVSPELLCEIEAAFHKADTDGTGALDQGEVYQLWGIVFPRMPVNELRKMSDDLWQELDPNGDGHVSWSEVEGYFGGNPEDWTEVDRMLMDHVVLRAPTLKERVWYCVDMDSPFYEEGIGRKSRISKTLVAVISNFTIVVSIFNMVIESLPSQEALKRRAIDAGVSENSGQSFAVESSCIAIFTFEFLVRLFSTPCWQTLWYNFFTWVDVFAIAPYYVGLMGASGGDSLVILRVLRLLRLLRMLKLGRRFEAVQVLVIAINKTFMPLSVAMVGINSVALLLMSSMMNSAEKFESEFDVSRELWIRWNSSTYLDAGQPVLIQSIPDGMWWAWVTLTTVGYGDVFPSTGPGKAVASVSMLMGLILMSFPVTLLASSFADTLSELRTKKGAKVRAESFSQKIARAVALEAKGKEDEKKEEDARGSLDPLCLAGGTNNDAEPVNASCKDEARIDLTPLDTTTSQVSAGAGLASKLSGGMGVIGAVGAFKRGMNNAKTDQDEAVGNGVPDRGDGPVHLSKHEKDMSTLQHQKQGSLFKPSIKSIPHLAKEINRMEKRTMDRFDHIEEMLAALLAGAPGSPGVAVSIPSPPPHPDPSAAAAAFAGALPARLRGLSSGLGPAEDGCTAGGDDDAVRAGRPGNPLQSQRQCAGGLSTAP